MHPGSLPSRKEPLPASMRETSPQISYGYLTGSVVDFPKGYRAPLQRMLGRVAPKKILKNRQALDGYRRA